jgi:glucose-1-phosphate thymidylyltransferase
VAIHPSARVESTVIRGPVVVGPRARISDAYIGPYTSIGPEVEVEGAEVEHSIIFAGASVSHLGGRLEGSVIGPKARVFRDFRLPKALRVQVGEQAEISLS